MIRPPKPPDPFLLTDEADCLSGNNKGDRNQRADYKQDKNRNIKTNNQTSTLLKPLYIGFGVPVFFTKFLILPARQTHAALLNIARLRLHVSLTIRDRPDTAFASALPVSNFDCTL